MTSTVSHRPSSAQRMRSWRARRRAGVTIVRLMVSREAVRALQRQGRLPHDQTPDAVSIGKAVADLLSSTVHSNT